MPLQPGVASLEASSHSRKAVVQIAFRPFPTDAVSASAPLMLAVERTRKLTSPVGQAETATAHCRKERE